MPKKKTAKSEKPEPKKWLEKIEKAKKVKDAWREKFSVPKCYAYYEGEQAPSGSEDYYIINRIFSYLQAELPTLYAADPYFYVKLAKSYSVNPMDVAQYEKQATVRMSMLNYLKRELKFKNKARLSIFDAHFQFGILKTHFYADLVDNPDAGKPVMMEDTELPIMGDNGAIIEPEVIPANEAYKVTRIHPDDFLVDGDAGPLDDEVCWKAQRIKVEISDLKDDKRYKKSALDKITPTELSDDAQKDRERRQKGMAVAEKSDDEPDTCVLWEIYDKKKKEWMVVAEGLSDEFLLDPAPLPDGIDGDPFEDLRFVQRDSSWYPIPPISQLLDLQKATNDVRTKMVVHRNRFNRKYVLYNLAFDDPDDAAAKLSNGEDGTVIKSNQPANIAVQPIADASLDQNHIMELNMLRADFEELAVGSNQRGSGSGIDSATEAGIIEQRTKVREGDKLSIVMDFISGTGKKLDQVVQANITQDQAVKVAGGPNGEYWELVRAADYGKINGEYEYSIDVGQSTPALPEIERAQWMAFLGLIASAPQLALSPALMKKMAELHHIYDENMVKEIQQISQQMMSGQLPMPGQQGSQPNVMQQNPASIGGGTAAGINNIRGGQQ